MDQDLKILNMIIDNGKPVLFAINKTDLLSKDELSEIYNTKKMQSEFISNLLKIEISAIKKKGFKKVFNLTNKLIDLSQKKYTTSKLNNLLFAACIVKFKGNIKFSESNLFNDKTDGSSATNTEIV